MLVQRMDSFTLEACAYGLAYLDRHEPEQSNNQQKAFNSR
jgi:hypothetical protein